VPELLAFCLMGTHLHAVVACDSVGVVRDCVQRMTALDASAEERGVAGSTRARPDRQLAATRGAA
jgi:hypothetical protein